MDGTAPRFNLSNVVAACIVAVGLVAAALIMAHRPAAPGTTAAAAKAAVAPPVAQQAVSDQFRAQVLAAPHLHTLQDDKGVNHDLTDVKVTQVVYSAKDDAFTVLFQMSWQPALPTSDQQDGDYSTTLSNDGYGHYYSPVSLALVDGLPHPNTWVALH